MAVTRSGDQIIVDGDNGGADVVSAATTISVDAIDDSFNDSGSGFGTGLADGDRILVKGFTEAENNGQFIVKSATTAKIIVYETERLTTEAAGDSVTVRERGPGYSLDDIHTALNPGDEAYFDVLIHPTTATATLTLTSSAVTRAYIMNARLLIKNDSLLRDHSCIWLQTYQHATNQAVEFENDYATVEMGHLNDDDPDKPVTVLGSTTAGNIRFGCLYSFMSSQSSQVWSDGGGGIFNFYGGHIKFRDDTNTGKSLPDGENEYYKSDFPTRTAIIQVNVENYGGATFNGTLYRVQESTFKSSRNYGLDFKGDTVRRMRDIITIRSDIGLELTGSGSPTITQLRLRGHTADLKVNGLTGDVVLVNSDTISALHATMTFGTGGSVLEANTYDVELVDTDGDGVDDVRCAVYRKSDGTVYGSEVLSAGGGTDTPSVVPTLQAKRNEYDTTYDGPPLAYGNFGIRVREFNYLFMDIEKVPGEAALEDTFILQDDSFLTETTEATVAAYTGFALDEGDSEIDITTAHTMAELYDWLKWKQYQSGEMDIEQLMKTKDGVSFTMPAGWDINGIANLDLTGKYIINRYVPVTIKNIVTGSRCAVVNAATGATLASGTSTGTTITLTVPYTAALSVFVRSRLAGYLPFSTLVTLAGNGQTVTASMLVDTNYVAPPSFGQDTPSFLDEDSDSSASATSLSVNPSDLVFSSHLAVIQIFLDASRTVTGPSGFTKFIDNVQYNTGTGYWTSAFYKILDGTEPASLSCSWTGTCGGSMFYAAFDGIDTTDPYEATSNKNLETSGSTIDSTPVTTVVDNSLVVNSFSCPLGTTYSASDATERIELNGGFFGEYIDVVKGTTPALGATLDAAKAYRHSWQHAFNSSEAKPRYITDEYNTGTGTTATSTISTSTADVGDLVWIELTKQNNAAVTPPSGFTQIYAGTDVGGGYYTYAYYKIIDGGDGPTYSCSWTGSVNFAQTAMAVRNVHPTDPFEAYTFKDHVGTGTSIDSTPVTTTEDESFIIVSFGVGGSSAFSNEDATEVSTNGSSQWLGIARLASAGASPAYGADLSPTIDNRHAWLYAFNPDTT